MAKYRKKPVVIEAIEWTGDNATEIQLFVGKHLKVFRPPYEMERDYVGIPNEAYRIIIPTLEGEMTANKHDMIIKGVNGECYPCKPDIFAKTYEKVDE